MCIEQFIIFITSLLFLLLIIYLYKTETKCNHKNKDNNHYPIINQKNVYTNGIEDTLLNPYSPPLNYEEDNNYKQIGFLKNNNVDKIIPLFGRPTLIKRDKWYYYTIYDTIKVPLHVDKRDCSNELGCDILNTGDIVEVQGIEYVSTIYKNSNYYNPNL